MFRVGEAPRVGERERRLRAVEAADFKVTTVAKALHRTIERGPFDAEEVRDVDGRAIITAANAVVTSKTTGSAIIALGRARAS